jgi:hypothetical protein
MRIVSSVEIARPANQVWALMVGSDMTRLVNLAPACDISAQRNSTVPGSGEARCYRGVREGVP